MNWATFNPASRHEAHRAVEKKRFLKAGREQKKEISKERVSSGKFALLRRTGGPCL